SPETLKVLLACYETGFQDIKIRLKSDSPLSVTLQCGTVFNSANSAVRFIYETQGQQVDTDTLQWFELEFSSLRCLVGDYCSNEEKKPLKEFPQLVSAISNLEKAISSKAFKCDCINKISAADCVVFSALSPIFCDPNHNMDGDFPNLIKQLQYFSNRGAFRSAWKEITGGSGEIAFKPYFCATKNQWKMDKSPKSTEHASKTNDQNSPAKDALTPEELNAAKISWETKSSVPRAKPRIHPVLPVEGE
uniref:GST C-terminal domain-containing protein n=1 Tax=Ciona savignyi TaxID=51511 RepID=H2YYM1_CIOSA